jgi:hypothetical protein
MNIEESFEESAIAMQEQVAHENATIDRVLADLQANQKRLEIPPTEITWALEQMQKGGTAQIDGDQYYITRDLEGGFEFHERQKAA